MKVFDGVRLGLIQAEVLADFAALDADIHDKGGRVAYRLTRAETLSDVWSTHDRAKAR